MVTPKCLAMRRQRCRRMFDVESGETRYPASPPEREDKESNASTTLCCTVL
jgi:hypothetical protein